MDERALVHLGDLNGICVESESKHPLDIPGHWQWPPLQNLPSLSRQSARVILLLTGSGLSHAGDGISGALGAGIGLALRAKKDGKVSGSQLLTARSNHRLPKPRWKSLGGANKRAHPSMIHPSPAAARAPRQWTGRWWWRQARWRRCSCWRSRRWGSRPRCRPWSSQRRSGRRLWTTHSPSAHALRIVEHN